MSRGDGGQQGPWQPGPPQEGWNSGGSHTKGRDVPLGGWDDEVNNPWGGYPEDTSRWKLEDSIPGMPGKSYPNLDKIPETSFDCRRQKSPGYYGDVESQCQVFHICQAGGRQNSFLCPVGTIFNQETFVCDWWFNVNCGDTASHYDRNSNLHRGSDIGIDGSKIMRVPTQSNNKGSDQSPPVGIPAWDQGNEGSWGMKGQMNQNRPQDSWSSSGGLRNNNKGTRRQSDGGRNRQNKGTSGLGMGTGMRPGTGMNAWPERGDGHQGGQQKGQMMGPNQMGRSGWGQQRNKENVQRPSQKGMNQLQNQNWGSNQKGETPGQNRNNQRRMDANQNMKGDIHRQRKPETRNRNVGAGQMGARNLGNQNRRMKGSSGRGGMSKGSNMNNWSMGLQNIQNQNTESNNMWNNNNNANIPPPSLQMNNQWPNNADNFDTVNQNNMQFKGDNSNSNWNNNQLNSNLVDGGGQQQQHNSFENVNNFGMQSSFNYDYNYSENNWSHKKKEVSNYQTGDNDYDYSQ
ncbi:putative uncharacterized protein DDB_G0286901 [Parasteatoda tepidariorum]|uniref:putative uncharacterized protein DDB_G0286901 n=1 Tax=Parasteatoda tepidariorum TaxID=114398 RepID=UPI001C728050|nr:putative uncharacterized protein DDB_G0286901 [Parasteatoda tepidariorum]